MSDKSLALNKYDKPFFVLYADLCESTKLKMQYQDPVFAIKLVLLHNAIVKENIIEGDIQTGKLDPQLQGLLKEMGDGVIAYFCDVRDVLTTACQIQKSFNIYNLLFPAHQLHTKISVAYNETGKRELFHTESIARNKEFENIHIKDFIGTVMDEVSRIQELTFKDEIVISNQVKQVAEERLRPKRVFAELFKPLGDVDEYRLKPLRGMGKVELYCLDWFPYPRRDPISKFLNTPETITVFPFDNINENLGDISLQIARFSRSKIRDLQDILNYIGTELDMFSDVILVGHSLKSWLKELRDPANRRMLEKKCLKISALLFDSDNINLLQNIFPEEEAKNIEIEINDSIDNVKSISSDIIRFRKTPYLFFDSWSFLSIDPVKLVETQEHPLAKKGWHLPWILICDALFSDEVAKNTFLQLVNNSKNCLTVELAIHDIVFTPRDPITNTSDNMSYIFALDWAYACNPEKISESIYIKQRKRFEYVFRKAAEY